MRDHSPDSARHTHTLLCCTSFVRATITTEHRQRDKRLVAIKTTLETRRRNLCCRIDRYIDVPYFVSDKQVHVLRLIAIVTTESAWCEWHREEISLWETVMRSHRDLWTQSHRWVRSIYPIWLVYGNSCSAYSYTAWRWYAHSPIRIKIPDK